jgi:homoserine dehydrogenase
MALGALLCRVRLARPQEKTHFKLLLVGFGNVGRAFASMLLSKRTLLSTEFGLTFTVVGVITSR